MNRDETVAGLRALPGELDVTLDGLTDAQLRQRPGEGEWSLLEICCHLRDAAEIEYERITRMAAEHEPLIRTYDQEALSRERRYNEQEPDIARAALVAAWGVLVDLIESLPADAWERFGRHEEQGRVTLGFRAGRQVEHPREHFGQMRKIRPPAAGQVA